MRRLIHGMLRKLRLIGSDYLGTLKCFGGVLAPNGNIYFAPFGLTKILELNPNTLSTQLVGNDVFDSNSVCVGGVLAPNGNIYFCPNGNYIIKFNPNTKIVTKIPTSSGYYGGVLAPNGNIYFAPQTGKKKIKEFNPVTNVINYIDIPVITGNSTSMYYGGVLAPNGNIYFCPGSANKVLELNPNTSAVQLVGSNYPDSNKWVSGSLALNGNIYFAPLGASQILELNPNTLTTKLVGSVYNNVGNRYAGGVLAPNGNIYFVPVNSSKVLELNPDTLTTRLIGNNLIGNDKWNSGVLAPNGNIYFAPRNINQIGELSGVNSPNVLGTNMLIPANLADLPTSNYNMYYNKY